MLMVLYSYCFFITSVISGSVSQGAPVAAQNPSSLRTLCSEYLALTSGPNKNATVNFDDLVESWSSPQADSVDLHFLAPVNSGNEESFFSFFYRDRLRKLSAQRAYELQRLWADGKERLVRYEEERDAILNLLGAWQNVPHQLATDYPMLRWMTRGLNALSAFLLLISGASWETHLLVHGTQLSFFEGIFAVGDTFFPEDTGRVYEFFRCAQQAVRSGKNRRYHLGLSFPVNAEGKNKFLFDIFIDSNRNNPRAGYALTLL